VLRRFTRSIPGGSVLREVVEKKTTQSATARQLAGDIYRSSGEALRVLDLGCGEGVSAAWFGELDDAVDWHGVDIEDSPEVRARRSNDPRMASFDGVHLPYPPEHFDMIYCDQVLEHVQRPYELLAEVRRVLKPSGTLVGSVAYLEPYHSFSIFNFTPYGMCTVMRQVGLQPTLIRHSSDAFYKIFRQMLGGWTGFTALSRFSILYGVISLAGRLTGSSVEDMNLLKIQYCGSFCFVGRR
jgi:ubiquinone/menaquinone biosynthesis C-methylase UbiE